MASRTLMRWRARPKRRTATIRREGREPLAFGRAIGMMMTERGLAAPAASGSTLAQWETILAEAAPELAGHVQAAAFDVESGRLDVVPDAPAYSTKVRWCAPKLIAAVNEQVVGTNVRAVHVLPPASHIITAPVPSAAAEPAPQPTVPAGPVKTRETASAGYRRALEAHRAVAPPHQQDPALGIAVVRQEQAPRPRSPDHPRRRAGPTPRRSADVARRGPGCVHEHACVRCSGPTQPSVPAWSRSATTSSRGSPRPNARDGSARSRVSRSASLAPRGNWRSWTPKPPEISGSSTWACLPSRTTPAAPRPSPTCRRPYDLGRHSR
ncbi:DciA family protein [Streptomyces sp. SBC-4]|nr:DciA family protein [Streptomyces sp. SBC-4]MDV5144025.1 DciA family protein [Streptomyces sp. SBC-4]